MFVKRLACFPNTRFEDLKAVYLKNQNNSKVTEEVMISMGKLDLLETEKNLEFWIQFLTGECGKVAITLLRNHFS